MKVPGEDRKTLGKIPYYPTAQELYSRLMHNHGWPYKRDGETYLKRDRALVALTYLTGSRISEVLRLHKYQFVARDGHIWVRAIKLSKCRVKRRPRRLQFRDARLPLTGERSVFTELVQDYLQTLDGDGGRLFSFNTTRAWQIITALLPDYTCHWLRAFCEDYLYDLWDHDLVAVADYVKVDPQTLRLYLRKRYERYPVG